MSSKASLDRELTIFLEKRYNKVFLSPEEVERETLVSPNCVPSTSDKQNTWLLRDVVEFINRPFYNKELGQMAKREKKMVVIKATSEALSKLWSNDSSLKSEPLAAKAAALEPLAQQEGV
ncbi:MAG: hypothetical protein LBE89_06975 [Helicobacteraceae bacterium]|jgi:hypothetical protein|nr:hypothetical protein [Helicobacteraceae bacterium]